MFDTKRWVVSFQKALRMLWEDHVSRAHGRLQANDLAAAGLSPQAHGGEGTVGVGLQGGAGERTRRANVLLADVVPPFVQKPPG
jgi:hypothetical protein